MIRFRDKQKDKAANANTPAKEAAPDVAPTSAVTKEAENIAGPLPKAEPANSDDVKR